MDETTERIMKKDAIADTEKMTGKHWSEFSEAENMLMLSHAFSVGQMKNAHFANLGDTYFSMGWNEFKSLIEKRGFKLGLKYDFPYSMLEPRTEELIIYYHPVDGLVICATSYSNKASVKSRQMMKILAPVFGIGCQPAGVLTRKICYSQHRMMSGKVCFQSSMNSGNMARSRTDGRRKTSGYGFWIM